MQKKIKELNIDVTILTTSTPNDIKNYLEYALIKIFQKNKLF